MNIQNKYTSLGKSILSGALCAGVLSASMGAQADEVTQIPLNVSKGVSPNMMFTLDDSTSMAWAYVPDNSFQVYEYLINSTSSRRFRAANTNPMYYNPNVIYDIPPEFNSSGEELVGSNKKLKSNFGSAPVNGYKPDDDLINLSENYRVIHTHNIPNTGYFTADNPTGYSTADNPRVDFACSVDIYSNGNTASCSMLGGSFTVKRDSWNSCSVTSIPTLNVAGKSYKPPVVYCNGSSGTYTASMLSRPMPAYYYEFDGRLKNGACAADKNNQYAGGEDCYRLRWVGTESAYDQKGVRLKRADGTLVDGKQNFANWYSFYKTRALATVSAAGVAFYNLSSDVRFTWQSLIHCTNLDISSSSSNRGSRCGVNKFQNYSSLHKAKFYDWLYNETRFNDAQGTPLRSAMVRSGEFLKGSKAWVKDPATNSGTSYACRPSYNIVMTDGSWNGDGSLTQPANHDDNPRNLPDGKGYAQQKPYADSATTTLADYAFHYWSTDLSTGTSGLANEVPAYIPYKNVSNPEAEYWDPRNNPATWQSMSNFIMGLGLTTSLGNTTIGIPWEGSTHAGQGYKALLAGDASWPAAGDSDQNKVHDLWHAALNSRGEFYSVDSPEAMVQAFKDILDRIADRKSSAAMPGTSSSLEAETEGADERLASYSYQSSFDNTEGWTGDIKKVKKYRKYMLNPDTQKVEFVDVVEPGWNAKDMLPAAANRKIMIADSTGSNLQDFKESNAGGPTENTSLAALLDIDPETGSSDGLWKERIKYIRGDKSNEGDGATNFRRRTSVLGDFLASQPVIVSGARYLEGFANRLEQTGTVANTAYSTFMESIKDRKERLYIGGNDGMLHVFETEFGKETFAFIPTTVFPKLKELTYKKYSHQYYVDGTPVVADVYDGVKWRTILVGTLRAGGKGLFALDITDPDAVELLWELDESTFPETTTNNEYSVKPGYSFPQPTVARLHNGQWAVVTGNGYEGKGASTGKAALYIINAVTGKMIKSLEVESALKTPNGLSTPRLADYDSDGVADYAYAGDLHGNLWRFDLLGNSATAATLTPPSNGSYGGKSDGDKKFKVSYDGQPIFTAISTAGSKRQPITSAPNLVRHPTRKGYLVMFGTGKYFEKGDKSGVDDYAQSLYGIWDQDTKAESTSEADANIPLSSLHVQTITEQTTGVGVISGKTRVARIISNTPVEWYKGFNSSSGEVVKRGWRLDLKSGTDKTYDGEMIIENMKTFGSMLVVSTLVPNDDPCANGSTNWTYAINPATGGRTLHHAFDTRAANNAIVSGIKFGSEGGTSFRPSETGTKLTMPGDEENIYLPPTSMGRQTWRMVPDA